MSTHLFHLNSTYLHYYQFDLTSHSDNQFISHKALKKNKTKIGILTRIFTIEFRLSSTKETQPHFRINNLLLKLFYKNTISNNANTKIIQYKYVYKDRLF